MQGAKKGGRGYSAGSKRPLSRSLGREPKTIKGEQRDEWYSRPLQESYVFQTPFDPLPNRTHGVNHSCAY